MRQKSSCPSLRTIFFLSVAFILATSGANDVSAAKIYAIANGDWDATSTWSTDSRTGPTCSCKPTASDSVVIDGWNVSVTSANAVAKNILVTNGSVAGDVILTIEDGYSLTVSDNLELEANNNTDNIELFLQTDGSSLSIGKDLILDMDNGERITIDMDNNTTIDISGNLTGDVSGSTGEDIRFEMNCTGSSTHFKVDGNFSITKNGGHEIQFNLANTSKFLVDGAATIDWDGASATGQDFMVTLIDTARLEFGGGLNLAFDEPSKGACDILIVLEDTSQFVVGTAGGSDEDCDINMTDGNIFKIDIDDKSQFILEDGDLNLSHAGDGVFRVLIANAGTSQTAKMTIKGNVSMTKSDGDDISLETFGNGSLAVTGDVTINATEFDLSLQHTTLQLQDASSMDIDGSLVMSQNHGSNNQLRIIMKNTAQLDVGSGSDSLYFEMKNGSFPNIDMSTDAILNVSGDFVYVYEDGTSGQDAQFDLTGADNEVNITRNLKFYNTKSEDEIHVSVGAGAELDVDGDIEMTGIDHEGGLRLDLNGACKLELGGDFKRDSAPNKFGILEMDNTSVLTYNGTSQQEVAGNSGSGSDAFAFTNIVFNNTFSTAPQLLMEGDISVTKLVTFTDGILSSPSTEELVIESGAYTTGASEASYVDGFISRVGKTPASAFQDGPNSDSYEFPVGDDGHYLPIYMTIPSDAADKFKARYYHSNPQDAGYNPNTHADASIQHVNDCNYWTLDRVNGTSSVSVRVSWSTTACDSTPLPDSAIVVRWNGSAWASHGNGGSSGSRASGSVVSSSAIENFSPFTYGTTDLNNPLPIELVEFEVKQRRDEKIIDIHWKTSSERENEFFTIERSKDLQNFEMVKVVPGKGNSNELIEYIDSDYSPFDGISYYRLSQTDFNGQTEYYNIQMVDLQSDNAFDRIDEIIYPNPSNGKKLFLKIPNIENDNVKVKVHDVLGNLFEYDSQVIDQGEYSVVALEMNQKLPVGSYMISVQVGGNTRAHKLMVR